METNTSQKPEAFKHIVLKYHLLLIGLAVGLVVGFILGVFLSYVLGLFVKPVFSFIGGIVITIIGNYIYMQLKKLLRGKKPYCNTSSTTGFIFLDAQVPNTTAALTAISKVHKIVTPSDS